MTPHAPTGGQAAPASPGASAPGSFLTAGPQAGQPGLAVPGRGLVPSAATVRVGCPAPTAAQCMDDRIRDAHARAVIRPISFPAVPWRAAADGGVGVHDQSITLTQGVDNPTQLGGVSTATPAYKGV